MIHILRRPVSTAAVAAVLLSGCQSQPPYDPPRVTDTPAPFVEEPAPSTGSPTEPRSAATTTAVAAPSRVPNRRAAPRSRVPKQLTGTWGGGSRNDSTGGRSYRISPDGSVVSSSRGVEVAGTVVVEASTMTLYLGTEALTVTWSYVDCDDPSGYGFPYKSLVLDGLTYVQDC